MRWAGRVAAAMDDSEVVAVHGFQPPWAEVSPDDHERLVAERRSALETTWVKPAVDVGARVRSMICDGDAREVLVEAAEAEHADLVVVGRTGHAGGPGFLHLGSVAEHAAHHVRRPLAIIPADTGPIARILVGVDGSAPSLNAVAWTAQAAKALGAAVVAVAVEEPHLEWTPSTNPDNWLRSVEGQIAEWVQPLSGQGTAVDCVAQRGLHPAEALIGAGAARGCDLIVVGLRGRGGFTGLRAGGVAMKVLHGATLPLVLVPPAE